MYLYPASFFVGEKTFLTSWSQIYLFPTPLTEGMHLNSTKFQHYEI